MNNWNVKNLKNAIKQKGFKLFWVTIIMARTHIHTYIHNWPLQPFSQNYGLASHTIHVGCVHFIRKWQDQHLLRKTEVYLPSESLPEICWEENAEEMFFFFIFSFDAWPTIRIRSLSHMHAACLRYLTRLNKFSCTFSSVRCPIINVGL